MIQLNQGKDIQSQLYCKYFSNPIIQVVTNTYKHTNIVVSLVALDCISEHMIKTGEKTSQMKFYYLINTKNYSKSHVLKKFSFQPLVFVCIIMP